jgi:hypothetical protein
MNKHAVQWAYTKRAKPFMKVIFSGSGGLSSNAARCGSFSKFEIDFSTPSELNSAGPGADEASICSGSGLAVAIITEEDGRRSRTNAWTNSMLQIASPVVGL